MPPIKTRRKDLPENRRSCILKAARGVFARQGFADTIVEDIAEQAGIGKGTLYLYFRSKEEIFLAALLEDARRLAQATEERMQAATTWQEKLQAYVDVRLEYLECSEDFLRIYLGEVRAMMVRGARMDSEFFYCMRTSEAQLAQVIAAAIARKEIRPVDPDMAAVTVSDLTRGLLERRLLGWTRSKTDARFALDLLCRSLTAEPGSPETSS